MLEVFFFVADPFKLLLQARGGVIFLGRVVKAIGRGFKGLLVRIPVQAVGDLPLGDSSHQCRGGELSVLSPNQMRPKRLS